MKTYVLLFNFTMLDIIRAKLLYICRSISLKNQNLRVLSFFRVYAIKRPFLILFLKQMKLKTNFRIINLQFSVFFSKLKSIVNFQIFCEELPLKILGCSVFFGFM